LHQQQQLLTRYPRIKSRRYTVLQGTDLPALDLKEGKNMFIRKRKSNWSIERAVYKPAVKDTEGTVVTHPVRTTEYVGSLKSWERYGNVASDLLDKLTDAEKLELKDALKGNELQPDFWLSQLDSSLRRAAGEIRACVELSSGADVTQRKSLDAKIKAIDAAWEFFFRTAQDHGLKRRSRRPPMAKTVVVSEK
jgi:hypothetical protein